MGCWIVAKGGSISIQAGFTMSNHVPVHLLLDPPSVWVAGQSCQIPSNVFQHGEVKEAIRLLWNRDWTDTADVEESVVQAPDFDLVEPDC